MTILIRPLRDNDEAQWRALWSAYLAFYETEVAPEIYASTFGRLTDPARPTQRCMVAETGDELVGLVHFIYHPHNWHLGDVCYLQDLFVAPTMRGTGIGRMLIEAVYRDADEYGAASVYWLTQDFNHQARHLYDRIATLTPFVKYAR